MIESVIYSKDMDDICVVYLPAIPGNDDSMAFEDSYGNSTVYGIFSVEWIVKEGDDSGSVRIILDLDKKDGWVESLFPSNSRSTAIKHTAERPEASITTRHVTASPQSLTVPVRYVILGCSAGMILGFLAAIMAMPSVKGKDMTFGVLQTCDQAASLYELEVSQSGDAIWIHSLEDGSTVGRFGKMGVDIHTTVSEQLAGAPQCRLCTHGRVSASDWNMFREKALEFWGVVVPEDAFNPILLIGKT